MSGLVLAILPLVINQPGNYVQGVETIKYLRTKRYRRYLDEHEAILGGQYAILINCLETILEDTVPEEKIFRLLADTKNPLWAESRMKYGDAVQQCLFWTKSREVDMESEEIQAAVFQYIVKPLVEDFDQFKDL